MSNFIDLSGQCFEDLEVIELDEERNEKERDRKKNGEIVNAKLYWKCKCHYEGCNNIESVEGHELRNGHKKRCSLHKYDSHKNRYDITSNNYGTGWTSNTNKEFYFDLEDYDKIKKYYWREANGYITCHKKVNGRPKAIALHRVVMDCTDNNMVVDHISGNRNDNRKSNLRIATYTRNAQNRRKTALNNTTGFTGVKYGRNDSYRAYITVNGEIIDLGTYDNFEDAVRKRIKAELEYFGEFSPSA